jgi:hypothetical protein
MRQRALRAVLGLLLVGFMTSNVVRADVCTMSWYHDAIPVVSIRVDHPTTFSPNTPTGSFNGTATAMATLWSKSEL